MPVTIHQDDFVDHNIVTCWLKYIEIAWQNVSLRISAIEEMVTWRVLDIIMPSLVEGRSWMWILTSQLKSPQA